MGISVRVVEYTGQIVTEGGDIGAVIRATSSDAAQYPLLAGVDEYDDTTFNSRQAAMLIAELEQLTAVTDDRNLHEAIAQLITLAKLLVPAPRRPHHRRLVFNGD
ncbi:hypothetical protein [Actinoplanes subtropicus]|uniref:hypothetical protein n=1 Tax=Actinoplanes subtropicus TaxID=543632 RepID=UPI0012F7AE87|nr:hypothetical protein [Actinoplanes subtropicus]